MLKKLSPTRNTTYASPSGGYMSSAKGGGGAGPRGRERRRRIGFWLVGGLGNHGGKKPSEAKAKYEQSGGTVEVVEEKGVERRPMWQAPIIRFHHSCIGATTVVHGQGATAPLARLTSRPG